MQYRSDKYGNKVSVLGYGCMRFSQKGGKIDLEKTEQEVMTAYKAGINYYDTAYIYPGSEAAIGTIFKKNGIRDNVLIATKLPHYMIKTKEDAEKYFQESVMDPERSPEELVEACCVAAHASRLKGDEVSFLKYVSKVIVGEGCSEICCELGDFYAERGDLEEAIIWYYNAVYETVPVLKLSAGGRDGLEGLIQCYERLNMMDQAEHYRRELQEL